MPAILLYRQKIYTSHLSKNCRKCPIFTSLSILSSHLRLFLHSFQSYEKQILASLLLYTHIHIHKNTHAYISLIHHCSINVWICRISGNTRIGCSTQPIKKKPVRPSVPLTYVRIEQLCSHCTNFCEILCLSVFRNSVWKTQFWLKCGRNNGRFTRIPLYFYFISFRSPQNEKNFRQELQRKSKHISTFNKFFQKSCRLWGNVKIYGRARQATDDNMAHAMYMLYNKSYFFLKIYCTENQWDTQGYKIRKVFL